MPFLFTKLSSPSSLSLSCHLRDSDALMIFRAISWTSLQYFCIFPVLGSPELDPALQLWPHQCCPEGRDQPPGLLATLLVMQPKVPLTIFAARASCCNEGHIAGWWSAAHTWEPPDPSGPPGSTSWSTSSLYWYLGWSSLVTRLCNLFILRCMSFLPAHFSSLSRSLWMASQPFWCICYSSQFCLICKVVFCPIILIINEEVTRCWPPTLSPCVLETCPQRDLLPLTTTLWTWSDSFRSTSLSFYITYWRYLWGSSRK